MRARTATAKTPAALLKTFQGIRYDIQNEYAPTVCANVRGFDESLRVAMAMKTLFSDQRNAQADILVSRECRHAAHCLKKLAHGFGLDMHRVQFQKRAEPRSLVFSATARLNPSLEQIASRSIEPPNSQS